jgi:hypothetical protein
LKRSHFRFRNIKTYDVETRTLDEVGLAGVRFVKADVEGGEREVLDGARATIARDRPIILLELLSGTHDNPAAETAAICETFGYEAFIVQRGEKIAALPASARIRAGGPTSSRATSYSCRDEAARTGCGRPASPPKPQNYRSAANGCMKSSTMVFGLWPGRTAASAALQPARQ